MTDRRRHAGSLIGSELIKIITLRWWWGAALGTICLAAALQLSITTAWQHGQLPAVQGQGQVGAIATIYVQPGLFLVGILVSGSEYQHGQLSTTLAAIPKRWHLGLAKLATSVVGGAPVAVLVVVLGQLLSLRLSAQPESSLERSMIILCGVGYLAAVAVIGWAVGTLTRSVLPAVAVVVGYTYVVSPLLRLTGRWADLLPDVAGYRLTQPELFAAGSVPLAPPILVLLLWVLGLLAAAIAALARRDA